MQDNQSSVQSVAASRAEILKRIESAAKAVGRDPAEICLTAVSKQQPWAKVAEALSAGQTVFGENRVQEAIERWTPSRESGAELELRLIGPLQTNKAKDAVRFFDVLETLDRENIVKAIANAAQAIGKCPRLLVQVNTGLEEQKAGIDPKETSAFLDLVDKTYGLKVEGLMCIPPVGDPPGLHFGLLRELARRNGLSVLSMGMSEDFETAVRFGATHVRVGSGIFGARAV